VTGDNVLKIKPDELTLGDIEMIEDLSGQPIGWLGNTDKPQGKMMVATAFAVGRRDDPKYTMEQARKMRVEVEQDGEETPVPLTSGTDESDKSPASLT
jgi:hypothetical protein